MRADPTLQDLDILELPALTDAVVYLLAEDLKASTGTYVLFVDAYEALVGGAAREGRVAAVDAWLRDVICQLDTGVVVVASREPLGWEQHDPEWSRRLHNLAIDDLSVPACLQLLSAAGVTDTTEAEALAAASAGVPFYLHLALDGRTADPRQDRSAVAPGAILERFLNHVDNGEVRLLELLSVPRLFDPEIFAAVAGEFSLAVHDERWDAIVGYSFVRPAGQPGQLQLHQLMVESLRLRLQPDTVKRLHKLLHILWSGRADEDTGRAATRREALYHGVRGEILDAASFLDGVDRIAAAGGKQAIDQVLVDLERYLDDPIDAKRRDAFTLAARHLRAETAVLLGDGVRADELTEGADLSATGPVADRFAVVSGHARRIRGRTAEALVIYTAVLDRAPDGPARRDAGLWAADLHMAQGRLAEALAVAGELLERAGGEDLEYLAEVERLRSLTCRFAFDFERSSLYMTTAQRYSDVAGSVITSANLAVNRAELLAFTDPAAAIDAAGVAIQAQRELGARHEIGKSYTALGVAQLALGDLDAAEQALRDACDVLDQVGYRSGRARAELFRAFVYARRGERAASVRSARWAIQELQDTEVYPVLIVAADVALALFGWHDPTIARAAASAHRTIQQPPGSPDLIAGLNASVAVLAGFDAAALYQAAADCSVSAGFYNSNVRVDSTLGPVNVRIPASGADEMDLRVLPEAAVLRAIGAVGIRAPRVRWAGVTPPFQIQDHVDGVVLDRMSPRGTPLPPFVIDDVVHLFGTLEGVPRDTLPAMEQGTWPEDGDVAGVARLLSAVTERVLRAHKPAFGRLWLALGIPDDPLEAVNSGWESLASRPFRLVHADVHRKNMIVTNGRVVFLDWELALWADPLYDIAAHLHKMAYFPTEQDRFLAGWQQAEVTAALTPWRRDLDTYLRHERIKSALVDSVRYAKLIRSGELTAAGNAQLVGKLVDKLVAAAAVWGTTVDAEPSRVRAAIDRC